MGKIGKFDYPNLDFDKAIAMVRIIEEKFLGKASNLKAYAEAVGHSSTSGPFKQKLSDLRKYGLIEKRGEIKSTELAKRIIHHNDSEAYKDSIMSIPLIKEIFERIGNTRPDDGFWLTISEIAQCEPQEAKNAAGKIGKIYINLISKISNMEEIKPIPERGGPIPPQVGTQSLGHGVHNLGLTIVFGTGKRIELDETPEDIDIAIQILERKKKQLSEKEGK